MGPSSQGNNIAVERYLGSCLISSAARKPKKPPDDIIIKQRQQYHHPQQQQQQQQHHQQPRHNNYVVSSEYSNGWTGMPLISMANTRRPNTNNNNINKKVNHQQQQQQENHQQNERSPLSRLAIHTQGAPLILSSNYGRKTGGKPNPPAPLRIILPRHPRPKEPLSTPSSPPASGSDSLSVASDESSGHSENSLPRIIKPRKRRKKERKPSLTTPEGESPSNSNPSIVTLQPYVPLCYEFDKFRQRSSKSKVTDKVIGPPKDVIRAVIPVEEEVISMCQCRYCDPAGLIWDFDTRCFSPSLNPPTSIPPRLSSLPMLRPSGSEYPWFIPHEGLRRSHSEPSNTLPIQRTTPTEPTPSPCYKVSQELEVTSEIVTSLNGHRDIEIKFFLPSSLTSDSTSSSSSLTREE